MQDKFADRSHAGRELAKVLAGRIGVLADDAGAKLRADVRILALPRGGVPVAFEVARTLHAPLDVMIVRKLGVPGREEFAMGAIASGGVRVLNDDVIGSLRISATALDHVVEREEAELHRREREYRSDRPPLEVADCIVIVVDDGLATGATMRAAVRALRRLDPRRIIVAVPVGAAETCDSLKLEADEVVCLETPEPFYAVGLWYHDFDQTSDDEVRDLMRAAQSGAGTHANWRQ